MDSTVLTSLSLVFVVTGLALLITGVTLSWRARRYRRSMQVLLQLGSQNLEPLDIPAAAWPGLVEAGWHHLTLTGDWFGNAVRTELGSAAIADSARLTATNPHRTNILNRQINSGNDVHLVLTLTHRADRGGERLFAEQLARVFVLLLETSLRTRTEALSVALAEQARLTLYLQHDMRNLAQWVGWVCSDFVACAEPQALLAAAQRLQENAPLAQERSQRLIAALGKTPMKERPTAIDLRLAITQAAQLAGVEIELSGQAQAWIATGLLARVLDNLFSNMAPKWRETAAAKPVMQLQTSPASATTAAMVEIHFLSPWPTTGEKIAPAKLFEPFASGRPGGLGLGLYQARKSLREAGGELRANPAKGGVSFLLRIPSTAP